MEPKAGENHMRVTDIWVKCEKIILNTRKYLKITNLMKELYPEFTKNSQKSVAKKPI